MVPRRGAKRRGWRQPSPTDMSISALQRPRNLSKSGQDAEWPKVGEAGGMTFHARLARSDGRCQGAGVFVCAAPSLSSHIPNLTHFCTKSIPLEARDQRHTLSILSLLALYSPPSTPQGDFLTDVGRSIEIPRSSKSYLSSVPHLEHRPSPAFSQLAHTSYGTKQIARSLLRLLQTRKFAADSSDCIPSHTTPALRGRWRTHPFRRR